MNAILLLTLMAAGFSTVLALASRHFRSNQEPLVDAIDALLPQTQCAQCGFPGCRPYAQAIAQGAPVNLCPPGGDAVHNALTQLLGAQPSTPPLSTIPQIAHIDESQCIGCFLCIEACPVDAILGAPHYVHTVLADHCTGCELCIDPCPVDCINLIPSSLPPIVPRKSRRRWPDNPEQACIRCGACETVCPADLMPQKMIWFGDAAQAELARCIECGLCNPVCPSNIDLVGRFHEARHRLAAKASDAQEAALAKARFERREVRNKLHHEKRELRRKRRIAQRSTRRWQP